MLKHREINPKICDRFKQKMSEQGWQITHQDVGQTELVGYGYIIVWELDGNKVVLHYADRQGVAQANLEVSSTVFDAVQSLINKLEESV